MGNLRGMCLNVADEKVLGALSVDAVTIDPNICGDARKKLANDNHVNISLGKEKDDAGRKIDISSIDSHAANQYSFTLTSAKYKLSFRDFTDVQPGHILEDVMSRLDDSDGMISRGDNCKDLLGVVGGLPLSYFPRYT